LKLLFLRSNLSLMIGKIVGTSLAGILQFWFGLLLDFR
jgi:hypothetical protein